MTKNIKDGKKIKEMIKKAEEYAAKEGIFYVRPTLEEYEKVLKEVIKAKPKEASKESHLPVKRKVTKDIQEEKA